MSAQFFLRHGVLKVLICVAKPRDRRPGLRATWEGEGRPQTSVACIIKNHLRKLCESSWRCRSAERLFQILGRATAKFLCPACS